jgi:hypothetical protein
MAGQGDYPFRSAWLLRGRVRGNGRFDALYKTTQVGGPDAADVAAFNDWFFEATAASYSLTVNPATVAIAGQSVGLSAGRSLTVTPSTVAIAGQSVTLTYTPLAASPPQFFGYGGPPPREPIERRKEDEDSAQPADIIEQRSTAMFLAIQAQIDSARVAEIRRIAAAEAKSLERLNAVMTAARQVRDAAQEKADRAHAEAQLWHEILALEIERYEIELDDDDVMLLAA